MPRKPKPDPRPDITEVMVRSMHNSIVELSSNAEENWEELGKLLVEMHDGKLYKKLGYSSLRDYASRGSLHIKERVCYLLMELVRYPYLEKIKHLPYSTGVQLVRLNESEIDAFLSLGVMSREDRRLATSRLEGREKHIQRLLKKKKTLEEALKKVSDELETFLLDS